MRFRTLLVLVFLVAAVPMSSRVAVAQTAAPDDERWSSFLPLMKEEAIKRGYELPLPFGVSVIYNYIGRDIDVFDVRIGVDGEELHSVSQFLNLGSNSSVNAALLKVDAFLLPFLNLYLLGGYLENESTSIGHVTVPRVVTPGPPREFDIEIETSLSGFVLGGGMTLAAGYGNFFITADANYSVTDIGFDDEFLALVASARAGWNGKFGDTPTRVWAGAAYWDTENTARSTVDVEGVGTVQFEADQGPAHPWNASIGGQAIFHKPWEAFAEYGFNFEDVQFFAGGIGYRF